MYFNKEQLVHTVHVNTGNGATRCLQSNKRCQLNDCLFHFKDIPITAFSSYM